MKIAHAIVITILLLLFVAFGAYLCSRVETEPFVGTWVHTGPGTIQLYSFRPDGTGEQRFISPSYRMDATDTFVWRTTGRVLTIEDFPGTILHTPANNRSFAWALSTKGDVLTLITDQYGNAEQYRRP